MSYIGPYPLTVIKPKSSSFNTSNGEIHLTELSNHIAAGSPNIYNIYNDYLSGKISQEERNRLLNKDTDANHIKSNPSDIAKDSAMDKYNNIMGPLAGHLGYTPNAVVGNLAGYFIAGKMGQGPTGRYFEEQGVPPIFNLMMSWLAQTTVGTTAVSVLKQAHNKHQEEIRAKEEQRMKLSTYEDIDSALTDMQREEGNMISNLIDKMIVHEDYNYSGIPGTDPVSLTPETDPITHDRQKNLLMVPPHERGIEWFLDYEYGDDAKSRAEYLTTAKEKILQGYKQKKAAEQKRQEQLQKRIDANLPKDMPGQ